MDPAGAKRTAHKEAETDGGACIEFPVDAARAKWEREVPVHQKLDRGIEHTCSILR